MLIKCNISNGSVLVYRDSFCFPWDPTLWGFTVHYYTSRTLLRRGCLIRRGRAMGRNKKRSSLRDTLDFGQNGSSSYRVVWLFFPRIVNGLHCGTRMIIMIIFTVYDAHVDFIRQIWHGVPHWHVKFCLSKPHTIDNYVIRVFSERLISSLAQLDH